MLHVVTWLWGDKWRPVYADRLFSSVSRHLRQPYRSVLITDRILAPNADVVCRLWLEDLPLLALPGCLVRMRLFDRAFQERIGAARGDRIVCIDVDAVITGDLDPLIDRNSEFTIMQGFNSTNPCPFNGSFWSFRAGERHDVWDDFSLNRFANRGGPVPVHAIPDDQGWLHHKFPNAAAYTPSQGVYAFKKRTWPTANLSLPVGARLVAFPGRDPGKYVWLDWVKTHWCG